MSKYRTAAQVLRELRTSQNRSLRTTAADLGLAPSHLSRIERGERNCSVELGLRIANYYGVSHDLIALAEGKLPEDIIGILRDHPEELARLRAAYPVSAKDETID
jgi:transcriptional regulator with XRE-family HTH domain